MNSGLISVIVPIYNTQKYLRRCVDSIIAQTYKNLEIILVDDGCSDGCPLICDEYARKDGRVKVVHKKNGGLSSARNAGLDAATGEYIGFVDSDDYISESMYESLYNALVSRDGSISNLMSVRVFSDGTTFPSKVPHTTSEDIDGERYYEELLLHKGDVSVCSKLFPAKMFDGKRFSEGTLNEDLLFMFSLSDEIKKINFVGEIGYYYFVREGSISNSYGKSICDMVDNSLTVKNFVHDKMPTLVKQADRFALFQHMCYILAVPKNLANKRNELYVRALKYLRKNAIKNIFNKYLSLRDKTIILSLAVCPRFIKGIRTHD